jgi:hypothetical protein
MTSFVLASLLSLTTALPQPTQSGEWTARLNDGWTNNSERWVSVQFHDNRRQWGFGVRRADLRGLPQDADDFTGDARFTLNRDAGTIAFDGSFRRGLGVGTYTFTGNQDYVTGMRRFGYEGLDTEKLLRLTIHDVSRAYATSMQEQRPSVDDLVKMRIHGLTPEFVRQARELGFKELSIDDLVKMRIHRVTPEYIKEIRDLGYKDVTLDQLVKLRIHRVTAEYIKAIRDLGYTNVSLDDYAKMRIHGVTPEFIKEVRGMGFKSLDSDEVVELAIHGRRWMRLLKDAKEKL